LGVVHEVNRDECFYAINGKAFCNREAIQVSDQEQLSGSLLATGFPYHSFGKMESYLNILTSFMQNTHGIRRVGSAAVDLAYVACGRFEGFFEYNLNAWDVAAGAYIVQCAGGIVTDFKDGENFLFGREIIAANEVHGAMLSTIREYWEDQNSDSTD
jgi:myo-inositol-1(or 4)-monophosphatase